MRYPDAGIAFLGGSAGAGRATPTSDLDILIVLADEPRDVGYVQTSTHQGWLVEAFVCSRSTAEKWIQEGRQVRRPFLDVVAATGLALTDNAATQAWSETARDALAAGPRKPTAAEINKGRYALSKALDDLRGNSDRAEGFAIAAEAFREAGLLSLLVQGGWMGDDKWLVRSLGATDDLGLVDWAASAARDPDDLATICQAVLDTAGGYLQDGFVQGELPEPD